MKIKILFIGLWYHHYTKAIIEEIEYNGCEVTYIDIQKRTVSFKVFKLLSPERYQHYLDRYHYFAIKRAASQEYDQVIFLQTHQMSYSNLTFLRQTQKKASFTLYNWDSLFVHDYLSRIHFFDRIISFDKDDANKHGFEYLPLFCTRSIQMIPRNLAKPLSVFMVGNIVNINRYLVVQMFKKYCKQYGIKFRTYLVISPVVWFRMLKKGILPTGIHLLSIPHCVLSRMTKKSNAVFDFSNHQQSGYTMRIIENLCAGKKIITNNRNVLVDQFFSPDRIMCYNDTDFSNVKDFLEIPLSDNNRHFDDFNIQVFTRHLLNKS